MDETCPRHMLGYCSQLPPAKWDAPVCGTTRKLFVLDIQSKESVKTFTPTFKYIGFNYSPFPCVIIATSIHAIKPYLHLYNLGTKTIPCDLSDQSLLPAKLE